MTERQQWNPDQVRALLQARGYDVAPADTRHGDNGISARRERADQAHLFAIDRGGRFRAEVTMSGGETRRTASLGAVPVVIVTQTQQLYTLTGNLPSWRHLPSVLAELDTLL